MREASPARSVSPARLPLPPPQSNDVETGSHNSNNNSNNGASGREDEDAPLATSQAVRPTPRTAPASPAGPGGVGNPLDWRVNMGDYRVGKMSDEDIAAVKKRDVREFYKVQNELIGKYEEVDAKIRGLESPTGGNGDEANAPAMVKIAINASFGTNIGLFAIKLFAAVYSGSLAVVASAVDSSLDLISGSIIFAAAKIAARKDKMQYPVGKSRLEPISLVIFASVMSVAALQLVIEGLKSFMAGAQNLEIDKVVYAVISTTVVAKASLFVLCYSLREASPSCAALAQDHRNDVITNTVTLGVLLAMGEDPGLWWLDPLTAMLLGIFIIITWTITGRGHVEHLTGKVAEKDLVSTITFCAMNHHKMIDYVDTVRAYYVGEKVLAEVDVVLPATSPLSEAHDVAEALQREIEQLDFVERAFVHVDTEFAHHESQEHTTGWV